MLELWIARDKDKRLFLYYAEPIRRSNGFEEPVTLESFEIDSDLFSEVTWENSPMKVELKIKR